MSTHKDAAPQDAHRTYVGPGEYYDLSSGLQFSLLLFSGLRSHHRVLDIGCGSLRLGKLLVPYLDAGGYYGVEPEKWLVDAAIAKELGETQVALKSPRFLYSDGFEFSSFSTRFDFCVAQSIFSHTTRAQIVQCLKSVADVLEPDGIFLATAYLGDDDYAGTEWVWPGCVAFRLATFEAIAEEAGLGVQVLDWPHPNGQVWMAIRHAAQAPLVQPLDAVMGITVEDIPIKTYFEPTSPCGYVDDIRRIGTTVLLNGWAVLPNSGRAADWIVVQRDGATVATAPVKKPRPDVADALGNPHVGMSGWETSFRFERTGETPASVAVYAYDATSRTAYTLAGRTDIPR